MENNNRHPHGSGDLREMWGQEQDQQQVTHQGTGSNQQEQQVLVFEAGPSQSGPSSNSSSSHNSMHHHNLQHVYGLEGGNISSDGYVEFQFAIFLLNKSQPKIDLNL